MKLKLLALTILAVVPLFLFGQGASLTIFSEDGDKFTLFLNGQQQNNVPQTNLRLDGLSQPYYKAKVVFEDKAKAAIDKNIPVNDPSTNAPADVVYKIKNKDGDMKLRYFSAQPIQPNYVPPSDVHVVHYGQPDNGTVTQTTVTTTTNGGSGGASITINASDGNNGNGGVNMNINVNDPNGNATITQTTTTTSSYSSSSSNSEYSTPPPPNSNCQYPMTGSNFKSAMESVKNASFDDTKLSTAQSIISGNCLSADQVVQLCKLFGFEESKLKFAKSAYLRTTDQGNYFKVNSVFSFDASKDELNKFIASGGR